MTTFRRTPDTPIKGRGAGSNAVGRFEACGREDVDDGWDTPPDERPATELTRDASRSIIARNDSPDVPFEQSINPYRGCEHGCVYCYARPSHAYLGHSPGLDFETRIHFKPDAALLLREAFSRRGYRCHILALGANTDPYQPVERRLGITRELLEVMLEHRHPVGIVTKSALVERDLDLLTELARRQLVHVRLSVTTLDPELARRMEPRAAAPRRRLATMERLAAAGIPVGVLFAPVIPALNDHELETVLKTCRQAGAAEAGYVFLRLPAEVRELFAEWLENHYPLRAERVLSHVRGARGGRLNDAGFGSRMRGTGAVAELIARRFRVACERAGYAPLPALDCGAFRARPDDGGGPQMSLF